MKLTPEICAWLAALIDGEGAIMMTRRQSKREASLTNVHHRIVVSVYNTDRRLMDALVERTGIDRVYTHTRTPKENHKKTAYSWRMTSRDIREIMPQVLPWLVCKREQAELVLEAAKLAELGGAKKGQKMAPLEDRIQWKARRDEIALEISRLNRKGRESIDS
jgi:hypothetical protein